LREEEHETQPTPDVIEKELPAGQQPGASLGNLLNPLLQIRHTFS
jgi:hypothetical protein